jgi:hypothetical protein
MRRRTAHAFTDAWCTDERQDVQQLAELATSEVRDRDDAERFFVKVVRDRTEV